MMFSPANLPANLVNLGGSWSLPGIVLGALGCAAWIARGTKESHRLLLWLGLAALPGSVAHLFFFHVDARFHLFALSVLVIAGAAAAVRLVPESVRRSAWLVPVTIVPILLVVLRPKDPVPTRRIVAEELARSTPTDAVIVSAIDPVYLEPIVVRGTRRRVIPVSRDVEYASKAVAWKRIEHPEPPPRGPSDHRAAGILAGGALDVVDFTADENPAQLAEWAREGVQVYVDRSFLPAKFPVDAIRRLGFALDPDPRRPWLGRLVLASAGR
jgi:hypothetical protein